MTITKYLTKSSEEKPSGAISALIEAGFTKQLVIPVAPPIAPGITVGGLGKTPARVSLNNDQWYYLNDWRNGVSDQVRETSDEAGANVGLILGTLHSEQNYICLDGDMTTGTSEEDRATVVAVQLRSRMIKAVEQYLGKPFPVRNTRPGRVAMVFRIKPGASAGRKDVVYLAHPKEGDLGKIEILANGQQVVMGGVHPVTMAPITWCMSDDETVTVPAPQIADIPMLESREAFNALLDAVLADLLLARISATRSTGTAQGTTKRTEEDQCPPSAEAVIEAFDLLPHDARIDRDAYVKLMQAASACRRILIDRDAASADEIDQLDIAVVAWASRWEDPRGEGTTVEKETGKWFDDWQNGGDYAGWPTIRGMADAMGVDEVSQHEAQGDFEPTEGPPPAWSKKRIEWKPGCLAELVTKTEDALLAAPLPIYQRGNDLVRPGVAKIRTRGSDTTTEAVVFSVIGDFGMLDLISQASIWETYDGRKKDFKVIDSPMPVARTLLSRKHLWRFPAITGIIAAPTLRPDGSVLSEPGYDEATGFFNTAADIALSSVLDAPTKQDAERALNLLNGLLEDFPFADAVQGRISAGRAAMLSGLLSAVCRGCLGPIPLHAINATAAGSGKTYYTDLVAGVSLGRSCPTQGVPNAVEFEKQLDGMLLAGHPLFCLDNCNGVLQSNKLCQALTASTLSLRPLGNSDMPEVSMQAMMIANGNNITIAGDLVRRALLTVLDPKVERPELRDFKQEPLDMIRADRSVYVEACLIIVRAYILAGRPGCIRPKLASFDAWSDNIRSALVWLGCEDPVATMEQVRAADPVLGALRSFMGSWPASLTNPKGQTVAELVEAANAPHPKAEIGSFRYLNPDWREALKNGPGLDTDPLGKWLRDNAGRVVDGKRIEKTEYKASGSIYRWIIQDIAALQEAA
ncbi:hypothetical protein [Acidisoma silvae]|uniref:DNA primase/polymerase bifunctional N-terminal domain-containing protein n=1 Tax=Acidisoma silvae TaxID=2802396 RepID=A0A963YX35_9PROT|nr:hypothetical protein [Acidisoma silvae]MCB8878439.1 hypothetical protein [Acidisoma silvae]